MIDIELTSPPKDNLDDVKLQWSNCERQKQAIRGEMKPLMDSMKQIKGEQSPYLQTLIEHMDSNDITEMAVGDWVIRRKAIKKKAFTEDFLNAHLDPEDVEKLKKEQEPATSMSITKAVRSAAVATESTPNQNKKRRRATNK